MIFFLLFTLTKLVSSLNIITFLIDDLGYSDLLAFNTPTIKNLSTYHGITLYDHNTAITCTPSRASFLTGKYPFRTGLNSALLYANPYGLSGHTTLPQVLSKNGFNTSLVGKWHIGYAKPKFLPKNNGFNHFYGTLNAASDHYTKDLNGARDLYNNDEPEINNIHSTDLYTNKAIEVIKQNKGKDLFLVISYQAVHTPLQVHKTWSNKCKIKNRFRNIYCGMMLQLDYNIKRIIKELNWDETFILFTSDNGGQTSFGALNHPLRGAKNSLYEGGNKGIAFISGGLVNGNHDYHGMLHISDWFPMMLRVAKLENKYNGLDGIDSLQNIFDNRPSNRKEMLLHFDNYTHSISYRWNNYKLLLGNTGDSTLYKPYDNNDCSVNEDLVDSLICFWMNWNSNVDFMYNEIIRELRTLIKGQPIGSDIVFGIKEFNDNIELYDLNYLDKEGSSESVNLAGDELFGFLLKEMVNRVEKYGAEYKNIEQYKWFSKDGNVKFREHSGEKFHYPWLKDEYKLDEMNFLFVRTAKMVVEILYYMFLWLFLISLIYKTRYTFLYLFIIGVESFIYVAL